MYITNKLPLPTLVLTCSTLIACGGGGGDGDSDTYTTGGTLSGLGSSNSVVLQNNAGDDLSLSSDGAFTFDTSLDDEASYAVTVLTQPSEQNCTVTNGTGTVNGANINDIAVDCVDQPAAEPADRFVVSGNNDGTLSIFRNNAMTGYATTMAYFDAGNGFAIQDMAYDNVNGRIVLITSNAIHVLSIDASSAEISELDSRDTRGSSSHLTLNTTGTVAYVASGTSSNQAVDMFTIGDTGVLSPVDTTSLSIDPDYIVLDPAEAYLYVVSRTNDEILIFSVNGDNSLATSPTTMPTETNPTALGFNTSGSKAYLTRQNDSDNLVVYDVASNGGLTQSTTFSNSNSPIDMAFNTDGSQLYVLDSSNKSINRYSVDGDGVLAFVDSTNVSFTATDITLGHTGERLYVSHSEDDLVSTIDISSTDGSLNVAGWVRAFSGAQTVASIGADGALEPTPTFLLAPDQAGLNIFVTASNGMLTQEATINVDSALIDGQVAVNGNDGLLLGAGTNEAEENLLTSYRFNPNSAETTQGDVHVINTADPTEPTRLALGKSDRYMYVLDVGDNFPDESFIHSYAYDASGTTIIDSTPVNTVSMSINKGPENMTIAPDGNYLYSVNSFNDTIAIYRIGRSNGSLTFFENFTPGTFGSQVGRPIDIKFHPSGRYAYVSLEDDRELVRFEVETNGRLSSGNTVVPPGTDINPGPLAVHPNGEFLYNGERSPGAVSVYAIDSGNFTLTHQSRVSASGSTPSWLEVDPQGRFLYARYRDETIEVFSIDASSGDLTTIQSSVDVGSAAGFLPTLTLVSPLQ